MESGCSIEFCSSWGAGALIITGASYRNATGAPAASTSGPAFAAAPAAIPLRIGAHTLRNRVVLAPMAGVTDLPFRSLCWRLGAGMVVAEMVSADPSLRETRKSRLRRAHGDESGPRSVQIAGADPLMMADAARYNRDQGAEIIDINMGCPAKKVCQRAAGSALLRDERLVARILRAVVEAVDVPVTLKIRTGWSPEERNGVTVARIAEQSGIAALAVHGRTRADRFNGAAEFATVAAIVAAVGIPVLANGDIDSPERAAAVLAETGAAGVMVGRAAQGRPWLCGQIAAWLEQGVRLPDPDAASRLRLMRQHVTALHDFHGVLRGVRIARKHVGWYVQARGMDADRLRSFIRDFNRIEDGAAQLASLEELHRFGEGLPAERSNSTRGDASWSRTATEAA
ncbi:MAG: tRNA dihydrouridine synthase DusB [Gammaproteobacteria bacterium]|nr:tRNA dihydrouridine synthase DusB [Gammaproteobacteria bacterium]